jgi:hypothetical protein
MVTDKDRMIEWLTRTADQIYDLRRKPRLSNDKCLAEIRQNYSVIAVLIDVANGKAKMQGISPPDV